MHRTLAILSSLAVVSAAGAMGCSSSTSSSGAPAGGCDTTAPVSFKTDVIPVFQRGCTLSSVCHGQMNNAAEENLYLGENAGMTDPNAVYSMLVGAPAKEAPSIPIVTKGDLDHSFLWQKVAVVGVPSMPLSSSLASACSMAMAKCQDCNATSPCGGAMPYLGEPLNSTDSCTLQSWIVQGAQNN
jgi:hypothetical protein